MPPSPTRTSGPKRGSRRAADDQLDAALGGDHRLDRVADRREPLVHVGRGGSDRGVVGKAERDTARIRLVEQAERLEHDRVAELGGGCACLVDGGCAAGSGERDAARRREALATRSSRRAAIGGAGCAHVGHAAGAAVAAGATRRASVSTTASMSR